MEKKESRRETPAFKSGIYRHYKGNYYRAFFVAQHSETEEWLVVYQQLYGDFAYSVRPLDMFIEEIARDGHTMARFEFIKEGL